MSGLDIFVTKSYDKTLVKQRGKKMADKKLGITKDMQRYAAVSKKPKETVNKGPKGMTLEENRKKSMKKPDSKVGPMRVTLAASKPRPLPKYSPKPKTNSEGKVIKPSPLKQYSPKPKYNAEGKLIKPVPLPKYSVNAQGKLVRPSKKGK